MAARVRRELGADVEVVGGPYGRFEVFVDGERVLEGGPLAALGVLPSSREVIAALRARLDDLENRPRISSTRANENAKPGDLTSGLPEKHPAE